MNFGTLTRNKIEENEKKKVILAGALNILSKTTHSEMKW